MILKLIGFIILVVSSVKTDTYQVTTNNGILKGTQNVTATNQSVYYSFRGIPYAQPPIGDLRFAAPLPIRNWSGILDATKNGNCCVQFSLNGSGQTIGSEDCLFINIYTTKLPSNNSDLLPVMVWIHGGMFLIGSGSTDIYGPDYLLDENIVIVTLNYRLGIFGFISTADEAAPGNFGIKDQLMALKWTKDNIAYFGGNPNDITLAGQSAGSVSIVILAQCSEAKELFQKAILESGSPLCLWSLSRNARNVAFITGAVLGFFSQNATKLIHRLRQVSINNLNSISALAQFIAIISSGNPLAGLVFAPVIEANSPGAVYTFKSHQNLFERNFANISYLMGYNSNEAGFFNSFIAFLRLYLSTYDIFPASLIPAGINFKNADSFRIGLNIFRHYFELKSLALQSTTTILNFVSQDQFVRPIIETARLLSRSTPVYFYEFSYVGNLGLLIENLSRTYPGVAHTEELCYIWITPGESSITITESEYATRKRLIRMWTNFIKIGNPTPIKDDLLQNVNWPLSTQIGDIATDLLYLDIGTNLVVKRNPRNDDIIYWKNLINKYGNPPFDTY